MTDTWQNCYDDGWRGLIVDEAFAHPAKMALGLTKRIFKHAFEQGWLKKGDTVCDPFGGIGSTAIVGAYEGCRVICVELEPRFHILALRNLLLHKKGWCCCGDRGTYMQLVQEIVSASEMRSHPQQRERNNENLLFAPMLASESKQDTSRGKQPALEGRSIRGSTGLCMDSRRWQGETRACPPDGKAFEPKDDAGRDRSPQERRSPRQSFRQLGSSNDIGTHETTSPERDQKNNSEVQMFGVQQDISIERRNAEILRLSCLQEEGAEAVLQNISCKTCGKLRVPLPTILQGDSRHLAAILEHRAELDLVCGSPPWHDSFGRGGDQLQYVGLLPNEDRRGRLGVGGQREYGTTPGNLSNLKPGDVQAIVGSPPYEEGLGHGGTPTRSNGRSEDRNLDAMQVGYEHLGIGDTFWSAAREIMLQCYAVLKPGGYAIWVVKAFVRKAKLVDFPGDWLKLCESCGFTLVCRHQAMLVKEWKEQDLFEGDLTRTRKRASFFRRLAERKGSPPIDWEDVLCLRRV